MTIMFLSLTLHPVSCLAEGSIKIGVIDTFSGPAAVFGKPALVGWKMAAEEINSSGGLNGLRIEVIARDDEFTDDKARAAAEELISKEQVDFLGGTTSSGCALAISEVARENKKIFMVHVARSDRITGEKGHRYVFRAAPNSVIDGKSGARYAKYKGYLKWFIIGEDYDYGRSIAENFWQEFVKLQPKAEKLGEAWVPLKTEDFTPSIREMMKKPTSAVYLAIGVSGMARYMKQAAEAGGLEKIRSFLVLLPDPVMVQSVADTPLGDNIFGSTSYLWYYPNTLANKEFVQKYMELEKKEGTSNPIPPGTSVFGGYCSARFLAEAIKKAGSLDTEKVVNALEGITIQTPIGPITMRACDHQALTPTYWGRVQNTRGFILPSLMSPYDVVPADLLPRCDEIISSRK
ncbi:MAG: ABC transporter substrate-binding protein [Chloroflexota bacterium]